jgi:glycosyltransferase involved in cell wall biosynthesis
MPKIGIGIVTYNRVARLKEVVSRVRQHTKGEYELIIADDGSTDGTREFAADAGVRCVTGPNRGVCGNKNRALISLETLGCDPILLLEDDCYPVEDGWDIHWRIGTALWHHLSFAHSKIASRIAYGMGTSHDPFVNQKSTAQCSSISARLLRAIGYLDPRFKGYGVGHAEWTTRAKRAGYGFKKLVLEDGRVARGNLFITGGLEARDAPTFKDKENIKRNEELFDSIKEDPLYRLPWINELEKEELRQELAAAGLRNLAYFSRPDSSESVTISEPTSSMKKSKPYRKAINKIFDDPRSFVVKSGWADTIATQVSSWNGAIVPWFNYAFLHFLTSKACSAWRTWRVLEFGSGYSTIWWSRRVGEVISIEHNAEWIALISKLLSPNATILTRTPTDPDAYIETAFEQAGLFEVIIIDGIHRENFTPMLASKLAEGGVIILDNSERSAYRPLKAGFISSGFKEIEFFGIAPMTQAATVTSVFYKDSNVFGI